MSEERFTRIEEKLDGLVTGQVELKRTVDGLVAGQVELKQTVDGLLTGQVELKQTVDGLVTGQEELQAGHMSLDRRLTRVEVSVEALRDDVKQIAEGHGATQAAIERAKDAIVAHIDRRIEPLERALRQTRHT